MEEITRKGGRASLTATLTATFLTIKRFCRANEGAEGRKYHHHFLGGCPEAPITRPQSPTRPPRQAYKFLPQTLPRRLTVRDPGELHRSRDNSYRNATGSLIPRRSAESSSRVASSKTPRRSRGRGIRSSYLRQMRRRGSRHHTGCGRWSRHGVDRGAAVRIWTSVGRLNCLAARIRERLVGWAGLVTRRQ